MTYRVALRHIPRTVDPYSTQVNTNHFIALQLYYPLFQRSPDGGLASEFLDSSLTKAEDSSFEKFLLCIKKEIRFSDGRTIALSDLAHSLTEAHRRQEMLPLIKSIEPAANCVKITLKKPDPRYFEKLTGVASTVTSASRSFGGFPIGLGPYRVKARSEDQVVLEATPGRVKGSFKVIEFRRFRDVLSDYADGVMDFNHTGQVTIPDEIEKNFQRVSRPFFKSYALIVNFPDRDLRRRFANCFPAEQLRTSLAMPLKSTPGFLPTGIQGSDQVTPLPRTTSRAVCTPKSDQTITFFNYRPELRLDLQRLLAEKGPNLPIRLHYQEGSLDELARRIFQDDKLAAVIGFDSSTSNSSAYAEAATFFESFMREARSERVISKPIPGLAELVRKAAQTSDAQIKSETYRKAHQLLLDSGYVIPLGQLDAEQFYPKTIRNIVWSDRISGFPDISLLEAEP
jgi:MarR-like DNA-binding transcriptional regulator SgrR of sgrS sRNA